MKKIKLMPEYGCYPLWHNDDMDIEDREYGDIDPDSLPISDLLKKDMYVWGKEYADTFNQDDPGKSGFSNKEQKLEFIDRGHKLLKRLQDELGPEYEVTDSYYLSEEHIDTIKNDTQKADTQKNDTQNVDTIIKKHPASNSFLSKMFIIIFLVIIIILGIKFIAS